MNLYLYIPPHSAHPPGTIRSLVYSQIRKYWYQNTKTEDFTNIVQTFFHRLVDCGHNKTKLTKLFHETAMALDRSSQQKMFPPNKDNISTQQNDTLYIKWRFHPNDIPRTTIQQVYHQTCERASTNSPQGFQQLTTETGETMAIKKLTIAYTRDRNLRDILIPSKLKQSTRYSVKQTLAVRNGDNN